MKRLLLIVLLLSTQAFSAYLSVENANFIQVESYHQFRVYFVDNDGSKKDVTSQCEFFISGEVELAPGKFYFPLPRHNRGEFIYKNLKVYYKSEKKEILTSNQYLRINPFPNGVAIHGPFYVYSGQIAQFQVYGQYSARRVLLTHQGVWRANRGMINGLGTYRAPRIPRNSQLSDQIHFQFGAAYSFHHFSIRN